MEYLTSFQVDLLTVIASRKDEDLSGSEIKDTIENDETFACDDLNHGRLYPNLDTLVEKGLVEKGTLDRRTNYYGITERGLAEINERLQVLEVAAAEA